MVMNVFYSKGQLFPVDRSLGKPEVVFAGAHIPLVPVDYRRASKLRVKVGADRRDYALLGGHIFDFTRIILPPIEREGDLVFKRFNGEEVAVIPLWR